MKKTLIAFVFTSVLIFMGCSQRIGDFTVISTKNYESNLKYKNVGRFTGEERVIFFIVPFGVPNIKNAVDRAIEAGKGVYLTNAVLETYSGLFQTGYNITGDVFAPASTSDLRDPNVELYEYMIVDGKPVLRSSANTIQITN